MKSIYSIIHDNLRKGLILSLGTTAAVLVVFSYFSLRAAETHATHFIMKHAAGLAEAGINEQKIGDVDKEISRFTEAWKETQDVDVRIDIFIDNKLIAHAGQLQPFKFLYTGVNQTMSLPSGQILNAQVQIGLKELIIIRGTELLVFELFILLVYVFLVRRMRKAISTLTKPLEMRVSWLKEIAGKLPESAKTLPSFEAVKVSEIDDLSQSIELLLKEIVKLEDHLAMVNFDRGRVKMAETVAHNIKGAIATLQLKIGKLPQLSSADKQELVSCVNSIRDVSVNLLKAKKDEHKNQIIIDADPATAHLQVVVSGAFEMKQKQYRDKPKLQMIFDDSKKLDGIHLKASASELQSVVSNLIDNSVEAINNDGGVIRLQVNLTGRHIEILIKDNGKGIPSEILQKLVTEGGSFNKPEGTGIGLTHARETLEKLGGELKINSVEGQGTTVTLLIPRSEGSRKFVSEIKISKGADLFIIDDDSLIHDVWKSKLSHSDLFYSKVHHFFKPADFNTWMDENGHGEYGSRHYFFDFDLKDETFNGLDLIERHGLALESLLISGLAGEADIQSRAKKLGVSCLRKDFLGETPIVENSAANNLQISNILSSKYH